MAINGNSDKILFQRGNSSKDALTNNTDNLGVLVIDPNKVINSENEIVDRYVKQEDLVIYASLKVYKKEESSVYFDGNESKVKENLSEPIYINFLNPLTNKKRPEGGFFNKNKLTTEWTDFFTNDASNDKSNDAQFITDPESFGITKIDIKINASFLPIITIEFTDVQGRVLFERGNQVDNPYNIFYTYPYPKFLLKYKGYYGKATETPLLLKKTNTRFDPSTGNYTVTAEFHSEIFALFNSFLIIYAYVAPFMFKLDNGGFLGGDILRSLYERQNEKIRKLINDDNEFRKYEIKNAPTLKDLSGALKNLKPESLNALNDVSVENNSKIIQYKRSIESYQSDIRSFVNDKFNTTIVDDNILYTLKDGNFSLSKREPSVLFDKLVTLNGFVNDTGNIPINNGTNKFKDNVKSTISKSNNEDLKQYGKKIKTTEIINSEIFKSENGDNFLNLNLFESVISIILGKIADLQNEIEETYLESKITNLGISLGYEPNLNNALRIISNNIQTFLILLDLVGKGAVNQLKSNKIRSLTQVKNGEHSVEFNRKRLTPFPNYYKKSIQSVSGKRLETNAQEYPGSEFINSDWFEVQFIEEIYNAVEEIKKNSDEGKTKGNTVEQKDTNILTLFQLGQEDLTNYVKDDYTLILGELMSKFGLLNSYSGLLYRGLKNTTSNIIPKLANFEMSLIRKEVFNRLSNDESRFVLGNEIQIATKSETINNINYTNLGNFGINFIGFRTKKTNDTSNKTPEEAYRILKSEYSKLNVFLSANYQTNNYTTALNNFKKTIINSVDKKDVYNLLSYDNIDNINLYSLTGDRTKELNHLIDLKSNFNYYPTPNINEELIGLTDEYTQIDETKSNSNVYQGFYSQLNDNLTKVNTEIDLGRSVSYGLEGVNALTFNTITEDYANLDSRKPFTLVTPIGVNHDIIFNQL